jgi:hypothetical protein
MKAGHSGVDDDMDCGLWTVGSGLWTADSGSQ